MPQMAPISWLILFFVFSITFLLFNVINYYCFNYTNETVTFKNNSNITDNTNYHFWKW